ncbi:hypothetical protein [Mucilaginibacter celer]|uniref:Uncharacterized protein n=1 Tax=Mucilaginibacter celer TaxID=2305508 RepID=A0A494VZ47_9SPHI|nr:hypothetical protein [Mucilaginibacter celer]AYL96415.1 hypothetical protein HYN43_014400 [Mucilaginibacter celer]
MSAYYDTPNLSSADIEKANKYTEALNELKKAVIGVNSKMPEFANGMKEGLIALGEKLPEVVDSIQKLNAQNKELAASGQKPKSILKELGSAFLSWNSALSIGITLIATYGPQVLSFVAKLFDSDKARAAAQALKDYKDMMEAFTQTVSRQSGEYMVLLSIAKNQNLADDVRLDALQKLIALSPDHLKSLTLANINTKEGTIAINEYTDALKRKAIEEAAQSKMAEVIKDRMDITEGYQAAKKRVEDYRAHPDHANKKNYKGGIYNVKQDAEDEYKEYAEKDAEIVKRMNSINSIVEQQLKSFTSKTQTQTPAKLTGKAYWDKVLSDQQDELNKLDAAAKDYKVKAQPIIEKIKQTRQTLLAYEVKIDEPKGRDKSGKTDDTAEALKELSESKDREAEILLGNYAKEIESTNKHFDDLKQRYKKHKETVSQLESERVATLAGINQKFQNEDLKKLEAYQEQLNKAARDFGKTAEELGLQQLRDEHTTKITEITQQAEDAAKQKSAIQKRIDDLNRQGRKQEADSLIQALQYEQDIIDKANTVKLEADEKFIADEKKIKQNIEKGKAQKVFDEKQNDLQTGIDNAHEDGNWKKEFDQKQRLLDLEKQQAITAAEGKEKALEKVTNDYHRKQQHLDKARLEAQAESQRKYLKTVDSLSNALTSIFGKNSAASRVAFRAHQAAAAAQVIIDTKKAIMGIWSADGAIPFVGVPKAIAETAIVAAVGASSLASIIKQKPGFASGGQYISDGRGALLPGYSRSDNTNAYLRSGEAIIVSEAMRNPWARNLVSAINVAHGGRDFSIPNPGRGYAIGGIFTDGGNANRYYNQPVNDVKDLANTLAYQMINNFPPVYVDVKDINTQQNILAQTINRVNL